jgi:RNA polymerase sigma factor (sigma-70 family)
MNGQDVASALPEVPVGSAVDRLASLFDVHYARLYGLARRLAPSKDDALDLVQETFLKAAQFPKSIPFGGAKEEAWLVRVLINIRRDQWRRASTRNRHDRTAIEDRRVATTGGDAEGALIARNTIWQALDALAPRRRAIVVMVELEGLGIPAIASLLGISAVTVRWHLSRGRRDLTGALKTYMGGSDERKR